jgi:hypothetical protein
MGDIGLRLSLEEEGRKEGRRSPKRQDGEDIIMDHLT